MKKVKSNVKTARTITGTVNRDVLEYTVGNDPEWDLHLAEWDCIGTAAHVTMLAAMPVNPPVMQPAECAAVIKELAAIIARIRQGRFSISRADQDVHMAVERMLTDRLGDTGRRVHTGRSRNDQVAVDLRLYSKNELLNTLDETLALARALCRFARKHKNVPMVGRTHLQPAMPSSVGLWASGYAEGLLDDIVTLEAAYTVNDRNPLGSAAGYGVPLPIDRRLTTRLLGFREPVHNVFYASCARGKVEGIILCALQQIMLELSRIAEDLIIFSMPEFGYFSLPKEFCTGSSIMPQKYNPDVLELVRGRTARIMGLAQGVLITRKALPGGYNRDLQETKGALIEGFNCVRGSLRMLAGIIDGIVVNREALLGAFSPGVFATDYALELVAAGRPFRAAYNHVREHLDELGCADPFKAVSRKTHLGATAGLDLKLLMSSISRHAASSKSRRRKFYGCLSKLVGVNYQEVK